MASFLGKLFPALFSNPAEEALARKMRINTALRRFETEVKKQDGFIKQYLQQATIAKRTGDAENYAQVKKALAFTFGCRKRAQRSLNSLRLFSTMSNQMEAYRDFCGAVQDISVSIGNAISTQDVVNAQAQLQKGMDTAKNTEELMDQVLSAFDSSFSELAPSELESSGMKNDDLDNMIATMVERKDTLTEDNITSLLNGAT